MITQLIHFKFHIQNNKSKIDQRLRLLEAGDLKGKTIEAMKHCLNYIFEVKKRPYLDLVAQITPRY